MDSLNDRIIPALAGNTADRVGRPRCAGDHPRSRGEYEERVREAMRHYGSSPLSRGIHGEGGSQLGGVRDHPRSRGEYAHGVKSVLTRAGSSPLSRGILPGTQFGGANLGIIPALAGNTRPRHQNLHPRQDHPRSRGGYLRQLPGQQHMGGSSPLSRGIRREVRRHIRTRGIIPALAGNTDWEHRPCRGQGDHPRSRGEYPLPRADITAPEGSSPLSRGILI